MKQEKTVSSLQQTVFEYTEILVRCVCAMLLVFTFLCRTAVVDGRSMLPTLRDGDRLVISRLAYHPQREDVVVITKPTKDNHPYIKRIIALEGDTVDIDFDRGEVFVNGELLQEDYINEPTYDSSDVSFPVTVPQGCVFAMGDNRNHSKDSRNSELGMIDERYILGRCILRIHPIDSFGFIR